VCRATDKTYRLDTRGGSRLPERLCDAAVRSRGACSPVDAGYTLPGARRRRHSRGSRTANGKAPNFANVFGTLAIDSAGNYYTLFDGTADDDDPAANPYHVYLEGPRWRCAGDCAGLEVHARAVTRSRWASQIALGFATH
jgi:hypothetical protein